MKKKRFLLLFAWLGFLMMSCSEKSTEQSVAKKPIRIDVSHLEKAFFAAKNKESIDSILLANPDVLEVYFQTKKSQSSALANLLFQIYQNKDFQKFYLQAQEPAFFGKNLWEKQLETAINQLREQYPNLKAPKVKTVFTGFGGAGQFPAQHLVVSDSLIVVGLDYFMGKKGLFVPPDLYDYQLKRLVPEGLAGQILLLYSGYFNKQNAQNRNLLNDMIWYGKNYYFTKQLLPSVPDSTLFGYTRAELEGANAFQDLIWEHFVANSLFYKKDEFIKTKYLGERPKTPEIGPACPGSIGRWLGYTIVQQYQQKFPEKSTKDIMNESDAEKLLLDSGYRGKGNSKE
jgi:hypothetical protein